MHIRLIKKKNVRSLIKLSRCLRSSSADPPTIISIVETNEATACSIEDEKLLVIMYSEFLFK